MKSKFLLSFLTLTILVVSTQSAIAQITQTQTYQPTNRVPVSDNTLGTQVSGTGGNFNITGGVNKGQTLFHSFTDFSVPTNGQANFLNPVGNRDIITRVTGNLFSDINGTVNSNGANFFLINPNGIVFGTNAQLNVGKAFVGSTANSLDLVGGGRTITFGTNPSGDAPLLSVAPNVLFDVSRLNLGGGTGAISNFGTLETTNPSQYIGLIGGNVSLNKGQVNAPGGRVDLGGLSAPGTVALGADVNNLKAQFPTNVARGDVSLINGATVAVRGAGGGDVEINARNVEILDGSIVRGGISSGFGTSATVAGDLKVNATEDVRLADISGISNEVEKGAVGKGGGVEISSRNLSVTGSALNAFTTGQGDAGTIKITAAGDVVFDSIKDGFGSGAFTTVEQGAVGNGGGVEINARNLSVTNGAQLTASTNGQGDAGKITINTQSKLMLANKGAITSSINQTGEGNGKGIFITARELELANGSYISTGTAQLKQVDGKGNSGDISIKTTGDIKISGYDLSAINPTKSDLSFIESSSTGQGNSGKITIDTQGKLFLFNRGVIQSIIFLDAIGNSQGININAKELELANGGLIGSSTFQTTQIDGKGNAGDITIKTTEDIQISGSQITSGSAGKGDTGKITIDTEGKLIIDQSSIFSSFFRNLLIFRNLGKKAIGNGRGLFITAQEVKLNNSFVGASSSQAAQVFGNNKAGDVNIKVQGAIQSKDSSIGTVSEELYPTGNISITSDKLILDKSVIFSTGVFVAGGDITISTGDKLLMQNNSLVNSQSLSGQRNDNGGNITISSPLIIALPGSNDITADAKNGNGGNVRITSQGLFGIQFRPKGQDSLTNDITASSTFGRNGNVNIDTPGTDPGKDSTELPNATTDASNQISQVCSANTRENKLTVTGRGGLPPNANDPLTSDVVWQDARATSQLVASSATTNPAKLIPPAVGWVFDGKGKVTLVAAGTQGQLTRTSVVCPGNK